MNYGWLNQISGERLGRTVREIGNLSRSKSGAREALAFTSVEDRLFDYVKDFALRLNQTYTVLNRRMDLYTDAIGNLYLVLDSDAEFYVSFGSHLDSVIEGGDFDGVLGVAAGLEILRVLFDNDVRAKAGFCLIVFRAEESSMTGVATLGSRIACGQISAEELNNLKYSVDGKRFSFKDLIVKKGHDWEKILHLAEHHFPMLDRYKCFVELHMEQGQVLERADRSVGIVEKGIGGALRWRVKKAFNLAEVEVSIGQKMFMLKVFGQRNHTGSTPMNGVRGENYRDDALVKSAKFLRALIDAGIDFKLHKLAVSNPIFTAVPSEINLEILISQSDLDGLLVRFDGVSLVGGIDVGRTVVWPMEDLNSLLEMILKVESLGEKFAKASGGVLTSTVCGIDFLNDEVNLMFDLRFIDEKLCVDYLAEFGGFLKEEGFSHERISKDSPAFFDEDVVSDLALCAEDIEGGEAFLLPSLPGHDARNMAKAGVKTGMIFVRCKGGVSHSKDEFVSPLDMKVATKVLAKFLYQKAFE
jgi:acetylornithine deacetylase/succinyl-diaminopimelate desuccinylase-like protein